MSASAAGSFLDHLAGTVATRSVLRQVITLADEAPMLTDRELRTRLLALADRARPRQ